MRKEDAEVVGWEKEAGGNPEARLLETPNMPKTRRAIKNCQWFLKDDKNIKIRSENPNNTEIQAIFKSAEEMQEAAACQMKAVYEKLLDSAEKVDTPMNQFDRQNTMHFSSSIKSSLDNTKYEEPLVKRTTQLAEKWETAVNAINKSREELCEKMSKEASLEWPHIVAKTKAVAFDGSGGAPKSGSVVLISGHRNRCGWDWSGREYGFAARVGGQLVAGLWEPYVFKALEHAWYTLKIQTSDRIPWDLVGVVEGPGSIGERTERILRDKNNAEVAKLEEWPPVPCLRVRVIALHAGPVAVGPA